VAIYNRESCEMHEMMGKRSRFAASVNKTKTTSTQAKGKSRQIKVTKGKLTLEKAEWSVQQDAMEATEGNKVDQGPSRSIKPKSSQIKPNQGKSRQLKAKQDRVGRSTGGNKGN